MATAVRRHAIVNPHRRRKAKARRRKNRARHLSAKQIRFFGTPAQKAALKRSRSAKRAAAHRNRSVPKKRNRRRAAHRTRRRSNPGDILSYAIPLGNPGRKRRSMAKHAKRRRASAKHRRNPARRAHRRHNRRHYRRNPPQIMGLLSQSIFIIGGAVGSKLLTQAVLGSNNVGVFGYAGNAAATAVLAMLTHAFVKNPRVRDGIIAGGAVQIVLRLITDYTPFGRYTAQLGMGDYIASNSVFPQRYLDALNSGMVDIPQPGWGGYPAVAPAAAGMGSLYGGNGCSALYG